MLLMTKEIESRLRKNNEARDEDHVPVVKFFNPTGGATWIITEMEPDRDTLFGLCDLGFGEPELGYVSLGELQSIRGRFGLGIERDLHFQTEKPLSEWMRAALEHRCIVEP